MSSDHYSRGLMLHQTKRYAEAEKEFRLALAEEPDNADAHAMLSFALVCLKRKGDALKQAREAVKYGPDEHFAHYALAVSYWSHADFKRACDSIKEAIRLDPEDADYRARLADIYLHQRKFNEAVHTAGEALELDAENMTALRVRGHALIELGRYDEADRDLDAALIIDPEDEDIHGSKGWVWLRRGNHEKAFVHFREALRLDPHDDWARKGVMHAMKARNPLYYPVLGCCLWMESLDNRFLLPLLVLIPPFRLIYFLFAIVLYAANQIFNLTLRFDPLGRTLLSSDDLRYNNFFLVLVVGLSLFIGYQNVYGDHAERHVTGYLVVSDKGETIEAIDIEAVDLKRWMIRVTRKVSSRWEPPRDKTERHASLRAEVEANGTLASPEVLNRSGSEAFDNSCKKALGPFAPAGAPPASFSPYSLIELDFDYQPKQPEQE